MQPTPIALGMAGVARGSVAASAFLPDKDDADYISAVQVFAGEGLDGALWVFEGTLLEVPIPRSFMEKPQQTKQQSPAA